ncbi:Hypothetical predicted protein [Olea europaea subsp. europaea]|uniref:Uncharacterized protein n=1 Tax=Olea europaea subsp. europaea TaxID=158383 RepID=A0A8S0QYB6_OLEEU|nr:Hypothetical predicted protein [Olea europaea subsp. europaea]
MVTLSVPIQLCPARVTLTQPLLQPPATTVTRITLTTSRITTRTHTPPAAPPISATSSPLLLGLLLYWVPSLLLSGLSSDPSSPSSELTRFSFLISPSGMNMRP